MNLMTGESDLPPDLATRADELLHATPHVGQLAGMATDAFEASGLDHDTLMLVWLAALLALDAPTESYLMNLGAASQTAVSVERVHRVLTALAPIVGTARVLSATSRIMELLSTDA
jgi:alkylhydroperoxidase/carboxymuconolactone decarboxylase family protein YurZ